MIMTSTLWLTMMVTSGNSLRLTNSFIPSLTMSMFTRFFQSIFTQSDNYVNSTCCDSVHVDAITGTVSVMFKNGDIYSYTNVSRRDIIKFAIDKSKSLGKFVNNVLLTDRVKCVAVFDRPRYKLGV